MADYTSRTYHGDVVRNSDGKTVAPTAYEYDPDYLAWVSWCESGGVPDIDDSLPPSYGVPSSLTPWQVRKGLNARMLRDQVEAVIALQPQDVRDGWVSATEFLRDDPLLNALAPTLGIDLDEFFRFASSL